MSSQSRVQSTAGLCSLLPSFNSRWQLGVWYWLQTYTMPLPEETTFSEPVSQSISSIHSLKNYFWSVHAGREYMHFYMRGLLWLIMWVVHFTTASITVALLAPKNATIFSHCLDGHSRWSQIFDDCRYRWQSWNVGRSSQPVHAWFSVYG